MACGSVTSFGSYLTEPIHSFFTDSRNRFSEKCSNIGFLDKILKTADPIFDLAEVIAKSHDAPTHVIGGIGKGRDLARTGRDATAFFNIFQSGIPSLVQSVKNVGALLEGLRDGSTAKLKEPEEDKPLQFNEVAVTEAEKKWALAEQFGKVVGGISFIVGFGACRPIGSVEKYITRDIDPTASKIGKAFPTVMLVTHVSGVLSSTCGLVFQQLAYDRAMKGTVTEKQTAAYSKKMLENGVTLSQKVLECVSSILLHAGTAVPAGVRIPLNLAAGLLSVAKEWNR